MNGGPLRGFSYPVTAPVFSPTNQSLGAHFSNHPTHHASHTSHYQQLKQLSSAPAHPDVPQMQGLPTPPPSIGYDVTDFRQFFQFGLQQLRHNNKYIINDLTTLASVYQHRMSPFIVKDIDQHIRDSHPAHRLVAFYVIDSICKNLGHPYPELFKPFIERLFLIAYRDVEEIDAITKVKFEELLGTWRTGSARGAELFGADVQRRIEDGVFGRWRRGGDMADSQAFLSGMKQQPAVATPAEKANILYDLRRILAERERIAFSYPNDQANLAQMATLQQLEQLVANQQLTINQVEEIRQQLQPLKPTTPPTLHASVTPVEHAHHHMAQPPALEFQSPMVDLTDPNSLANLAKLLESNSHILLPPAIQPDHNVLTSSHPLAAMLNSVAHLQGTIPNPAVHVPPPDSSVTPNVAATPNLFNSEQLAAALASLNPPLNSTLATDNGEGGSRERSAELIVPHLSPAPSITSHDAGDQNVQEYEEYVLGLGIELTTTSINRVDPSTISDVLYGRIPQHCRQDGARFLNGRIGDSRASAQLDAHFRLQRRVLEQTNRPQQRIWAVLEADWVKSHDFGVEHDNKKREKVAEESAASVAAVQIKTTAELKQKMVLRPTEPTEASKLCPICREGFETKFDEEEEEYYWLNAIESGSRKGSGTTSIYHATCHFETMRNKAKMKLRREEEEANLRKSREENEKLVGDDKIKVKTEEEDGDAESATRRRTSEEVIGDDYNGGSSSKSGSGCGKNSDLQVDEDFFSDFVNGPNGDDQGSHLSLDLGQEGIKATQSISLNNNHSNKRKSSESESSDDDVVVVNGLTGLDEDVGSLKKKSRTIVIDA
ncbi:hypothetical protein CROQUDRAFT_77413 [Cronartium quercuum f. sp. fusiforme G11]|uniref:CID domain-containing protein n=1 Tax=Cronartium quercuum f. sp. fusiforme G11 TaxID=708437 RepID=A0A9P6NNE9_9BASI|nr:hypothetical protein CROQUDRAFT_77413 [Cronartium quercuum f. sp. fusiforme G11]